MEKLLNTLLEVKTEERKDKGVIDGYNLTFSDPRIATIYKNVSNALISVDSATKEKDDIIQEISLAIWEVTPVFISNTRASLEELLEAIKKENNEIAAKYFTYLNIKAVGAVKDKYKVTNVDKEKVIEEVFFTDVIKGNFSEEQIADKLNMADIDLESSSNFIIWLKDNADKILTNKQIEYLNNDMIGFTAKQNFDFRNNIAKRVLKYLNMNQYSTSNIKKIELLQQIDILSSVNGNFENTKSADCKEFYINLKANLDAPIVNDIIYSDKFTFEELKEITELYNGTSNNLSLRLTSKIRWSINNKIHELRKKIVK